MDKVKYIILYVIFIYVQMYMILQEVLLHFVQISF